MYGSSYPGQPNQDESSYRGDNVPYQLLPIGGMLHAVRPGVGAVAGLGGQSPAAILPHIHPGVGTPQGPMLQPGQQLSAGGAANTLIMDPSLLMPPSMLQTPPPPPPPVMAMPTHPPSPLLVPPVHHTALPRARQLFGGPTRAPAFQPGQPILQQQAPLPTVGQQAYAWAQPEQVLQLQQPTVQHMSPTQQRPIWQPPLGTVGSPMTLASPHAHLQQEFLERRSQDLQRELLQVRLQQQQLRHVHSMDPTVAGQFPANTALTAAAAAATAGTPAMGSSSGGAGASSGATASPAARRKTRRGPNRGRSKNKKGATEGSAGEQSGAQTTSSTGGSASTPSDTEEQQQQQQAQPTGSDRAESSVAGSTTQQQAQQQAAGQGAVKSKKAVGEKHPQQATEQSRTADARQPQDRRGPASAAVSTPTAAGGAAAPTSGPKQLPQRTTGLSHRQRYRRKQWELHRAMEQERLKQQQQQVEVLAGQLEGVSLTSIPGAQHVGPQQLAGGGLGLLPQPAQSISQLGVMGISAEGASSSAAHQQSLQQQDVTATSAALPAGSLDQNLDDWLSKFLEL